MGYTLGQAAKAAGKSKMTIARAIKAGKLSAAKAEDGTYAIDPAELSRVYPPPVGNSTDNSDGTLRRDEPGNAVVAVTALLQERERRIEEQAETIRQLWARLDREVDERRRLLSMLVDRRPWWRRWFR